MYKILLKIYLVYAFSWIDFSPNLMGPSSLVQSRTLHLEIVKKLEKKFLKGCPNCMNFWSKIKGVKRKTTKFYASNGFCSHLHNFISFLLKLQMLVENELNYIWYFITQRPNNFFKYTFLRRSETKNVSDKI